MTEIANSSFASLLTVGTEKLVLSDGDRIGVIGGGPAGSFFAYFVQRMAESVGLQVSVDVYEPRHFSHCGPAGCNHCGGVVSESLVQLLATEGIVLPTELVQRGIESYVLHMDVGQVSIQAAALEKRIAAVYRGNGPRDSEAVNIAGFDRFMLDLSKSLGASVMHKVVRHIDWIEGRPQVVTVDGSALTYDLVAVAAGVNSQALHLLGHAAQNYEEPETVKAFIAEFRLGREAVQACLGASMHVFLLDLPHLEFAALIPKGDFITLCLLGDEINDELVRTFLGSDEVKACFPASVVPPLACHCFPRINVQAAVHPFADRIVWIGDSGVCKLYKDGIGSAYKTAKAAATTAIFKGVSAGDFEGRFWRECSALKTDNSIAKLIFAITKLIQKLRFLRHGVLRMVALEQRRAPARRHMSNMLWDVFTGSAPYKEILLRSLKPEFPVQLVWNVAASNCRRVFKSQKGG